VPCAAIGRRLNWRNPTPNGADARIIADAPRLACQLSETGALDERIAMVSTKTRTKKVDQLQRQIDEKRSEIHSDQYSISIGEIANLYRDQELDIHPEFQRFYRWTDEQKSRFVESILLGIPIPSLFVAQREDGKWDVIDGLQRLSTIFQLMGILKEQDGKKVPPLVLTKTKYLPAMEGVAWKGAESSQSLSAAQQLYIKRAKFDFKIILRESDESAKFELFQRLNTGGAELSDQEIRNAMLVAANRDFFEWLKALATLPEFEQCVSLSDRSYDEQFDLEVVLRFLVLRTIDLKELSGMGDLGDFLTGRMMSLADSFGTWKRKEDTAFRRTFELIAGTASQDAFRKFDKVNNRFTRGFSISAFEVVGLGMGYNIERLPDPKVSIEDKIRKLWSDKDFLESSGSGVRASTRIPKTLELGRNLFQP